MDDSTFTSGAEKGTKSMGMSDDVSSFTGSADKAASADLNRERSASWVPFDVAPDSIKRQARFYPPRLGDLIFKMFCDNNGNMWIVEYGNPGGGPEYVMFMPRREATAPTQVGTPAKTNLADEAQQKECP